MRGISISLSLSLGRKGLCFSKIHIITSLWHWPHWTLAPTNTLLGAGFLSVWFTTLTSSLLLQAFYWFGPPTRGQWGQRGPSDRGKGKQINGYGGSRQSLDLYLTIHVNPCAPLANWDSRDHS